MINFKPGDLAVYPNHGVGEVVSIEDKTLGTQSVSCYVVDILATGSKVFVPICSANRMGLRTITDSGEAEGVYGLFHVRTPEMLKMNWNKRFRCLQEKMKTGKISDVALVVSDLLFLKRKKGLSYGEDKLLCEAEEILITELSIAEKESKDVIREKIHLMSAKAS